MTYRAQQRNHVAPPTGMQARIMSCMGGITRYGAMELILRPYVYLIQGPLDG
ncbi:hypothetical protein [Paenibacillus puerhi]|uniref:hypothetical protein n=1 Tax=Paenibacillus puerhi TaxID=2692622 RepID=UPI0013572D10|nr:hypothetical protein [Paenibacillus puerhi]